MLAMYLADWVDLHFKGWSLPANIKYQEQEGCISNTKEKKNKNLAVNADSLNHNRFGHLGLDHLKRAGNEKNHGKKYFLSAVKVPNRTERN